MIESEDLISELNDQQKEAVKYLSGPELVIAGAGSGKTRVLTYKVAYMIARGLAPEHIMALTFTNKAAREMRERIGALVGNAFAWRIAMGTFHSVFGRIMRPHADLIGYSRNYTIYDTSDSKALIKKIIKEMALDDKNYTVKKMMGKISQLKNSLITWQGYANDREAIAEDGYHHIPQFAAVYERYCVRCKAADAMDFDDLLLNMNILLRDHPEVLNGLQDQFQYILVDEYQDTNASQSLIVQMLANKHHRLCVVGDDAQSIYSFRGANIENILRFGQNNEGCRVFKLERNYRSTQTIVAAANSLIRKNVNQLEKNVYSMEDEGEKIDVLECRNEYDEADNVALKVKRLLREGVEASEVAILYRTNAQSRVVEESLRKEGIIYKVYGGQSFYQRKEIKDALAYMRLTQNVKDEESLTRIVNVPARGIGETTVNKCLQAARAAGVSVFEVMSNPLNYGTDVNSGTVAKLQRFTTMIGNLADYVAHAGAYDGAHQVLLVSGLLADASAELDAESIARKENLEELLKAVKDFETRREEEREDETTNTLRDFLAEAVLQTDQDMDEDEDGQSKEYVTLMTAHASKGLEYNHIFIIGLEEELFPSQMATEVQEVEEERRLLYVAMTRAKQTCSMSYAKSRTMYGNGSAFRNPSRFLKDIDAKYLRRSHSNAAFFTNDFSSIFGSAPRTIYSSYEKSVSVNKPTSTTASTERKTSTWGKSLGRTQSSSERINRTPQGIEEGMRVRHSIFGEGSVLSIEKNGSDFRLKVDFGSQGVKNLLARYAKLEIIR